MQVDSDNQQAEPSTTAADNPPRPALLRRLAAMGYDTFLLLPVIMATVAVATGIAVALRGDPGDDYSATLPPLLVQALAVACIVGFYGYFWRHLGQTLGMKAWRIRLYSTRGESVTWLQVALRCVGAALSLAMLGLGYLWCLVDREGRSWHDHLSGTALELLPKRSKK